MSSKSWTTLAKCQESPIRLAIDTEYQMHETLTVQAAIRIDKRICVQVYHSPKVPPPKKYFGKQFQNQFTICGLKVCVLAAKVLTNDLTPARILTDLLNLDQPQFLSRQDVSWEGKSPSLRQGHRLGTAEGKKLPEIVIAWSGHFLHADLFRALGSNFLSSLLLGNEGQPSEIRVRDGKVLGFVGHKRSEKFKPPVVEYVREGETLIAVRLDTLDTNCVAGPCKLDDLAKAFLGMGKSTDISEEEKANMRRVFKKRPKQAYQYAIRDVVITLAIAERFEQQHRDLYDKYGLVAGCPRMHGTPGLRIATLILLHTWRQVAAGSTLLPTIYALKELMAGAGSHCLSKDSKFKDQTGATHGGLTYSRSPTMFAHLAPGMLRDVDLTSCYPSIIANMNIFIGRPVVWEPGNKAIPLADVIHILENHAAGQDAWFIKVSGPLPHGVNTLIPSTADALTLANYRNRTRKERSKTRHDRLNATTLPDNFQNRQYTRLLTHEVNSGVITWATWMMIQALPRAFRQDYENLQVETIVFYPKVCVAHSGEQYDTLTGKLKTGALVPWEQVLDLLSCTKTTHEQIDERYIALRCPMKELTHTLLELRRSAEKNRGPSKVLKVLANTLYGAFASPHLPTNNVVAANVITGVARALAFALHLSLNGIQVITDGVSYRRDQIPAIPLAQLLNKAPEYPIRRPETALPFLTAQKAPEKPEAFRRWYLKHVMHFFGVSGKEPYRQLFALHNLEHKKLPNRTEVSFDGLLTDGAANYCKLIKRREFWKVVDAKARSFGAKALNSIKPWLADCYILDRYQEPPITESYDLLNMRDAAGAVRNALDPLALNHLIVPLGCARPRVKVYKVIKQSGFLFRTEKQHRRISKIWENLSLDTGCGPETLAWRKTYKNQLTKVAERIWKLIRADHQDKETLKNLNLNLLRRVGQRANKYGQIVNRRRKKLRLLFNRSLLIQGTPPLTGLVITARDLPNLKQIVDCAAASRAQ
jgi:hypothetical protein